MHLHRDSGTLPSVTDRSSHPRRDRAEPKEAMWETGPVSNHLRQLTGFDREAENTTHLTSSLVRAAAPNSKLSGMDYFTKKK